MYNNVRGIVIDPGHGGVDSGAVGNGIIEKDYTLKISKYMYDRFKDLGIPVIMTRTEDITLTPDERVNKVKSAFGNYQDVLVISNHINAGEGDGSEVIYALRNNDTLANSILDELAKAGQNIRGAYQRKSTVNPNKDYYFMQRNTGDTESITIEYGFLDSTKDDVAQIKNNWQKYAEAAVQGILNYIKGGTIEEGIYIVKQGDSLYSIANKYNTTVNDIKRLNNLSSNELSIGQRLKIPVISNNDNYYLVKKGDTLYSIARNNNITVLELKRLNNLTSNEIYEGQKLIIKPSSNIDIDTYTVQVGDTLYSIAKKYGISVDELKKANNITNNLLSVDQKLIIPKTKRIYIVQNGDTLYKIANQNNTTVQKIKELNNLTNDLLMVGQELFL